MWERTLNPYKGTWEVIASSAVPDGVIAWHNRVVRCGLSRPWFHGQKFYYRFTYCV